MLFRKLNLKNCQDLSLSLSPPVSYTHLDVYKRQLLPNSHYYLLTPLTYIVLLSIL